MATEHLSQLSQHVGPAVTSAQSSFKTAANKSRHHYCYTLILLNNES